MDESTVDEGSLPFSFPSYFIDEDAVVCLEGDACLVKAALRSQDAEDTPAADTSVACDLCDFWYHAECVAFDEEQTFFYCPRCVAAHEKAGKSLYPAKSRSQISPEARTSSLPMGPLACDVRTLLCGSSVAIAPAEEGESAVSVSMHRLPAQANPVSRANTAEQGKRDMLSPIRESIKVSQPYSQKMRLLTREPPKVSRNTEVMWSPVREPPKVSQSTEVMWSPIREPLTIPQKYDLWSPTTTGLFDQGLIDVESLSPTPASEKAMTNSFQEERKTSSEVVAETSKSVNSNAKYDSKHGDSRGGFTSPAEQHLGRRPAMTKAVDVVGAGEDISTQPTPLARPSKELEGFSPSRDTIKSNEKGCDHSQLQATVENLPKKKQVALREDERRIESKDLPEPPRKVARKVAKKVDLVGARNVAVAEDSCGKIAVVENAVAKNNDSQSREAGNCIISKDIPKENSVEFPEEDFSDLQSQDPLKEGDDQAAPAGGSNSNVDVMDIVSGPSYSRKRSNNQMGVRTRIIMPRETDGQDVVTSSLFEHVKEQMKDSMGYVGGSPVNGEIPNDKFIAAFKAALNRSREKNKALNSAVSSEKKVKWLPKFLKNASSRESLTRKLYAGGTGRWDRDWEIAFRKERSGSLRTAQKNAEDEIEGPNNIRKRAAVENEKPGVEEDSIFSRLYVADTSLFPRNDDVQPLSAKSEPTERGARTSQTSRDPGTKLRQGLVDKPTNREVPSDRSTDSEILENRLGVYNLMGTTKTATPTSKPASSASLADSRSREGISPKLSAKAGSIPSLSSDAHRTSLNDSTSPKDDVKKDKRQWALDVLARQQGTYRQSSGSSSKAEGSVNRDSQFSLLLQLPESLRPILPHDRRSKIPTAVRQVQLNRFVEHELKRANLTDIANSSDCEEIVQLAKAREDALYKRSKSKIVYLNLCVRSLAHTDTVLKVEQDTQVDVSKIVQKALEAAGLIDSPPPSPSLNNDSHNSADGAVNASSNHSNCKSQTNDDERRENDLEKRSFEMRGDLEDSGENPEAVIVVGRSCSSNLSSGGKVPDPDEGVSVNTVIDAQTNASVVRPASSENGPKVPLQKNLSNESILDICIAKAVPVPVDEGHVSEEAVPISGVPGQSTPVQDNGDTILTPKESVPEADLHPPKATHLSSLSQDFDLSSRSAVDIPSIADDVASEVPEKVDHSGMDEDWMSAGNFADLDRRIENIRQNTSPSSNRELDVPWNASRTVAELSSQTQAHDSNRSVKKQVEIFVNQHLKPLYRSGVIKADQFRYVVSKTASKVMEHHQDASSAEFLITEGSKVRKLADQYLQAYSKRKTK